MSRVLPRCTWGLTFGDFRLRIFEATTKTRTPMTTPQPMLIIIVQLLTAPSLVAVKSPIRSALVSVWWCTAFIFEISLQSSNTNVWTKKWLCGFCFSRHLRDILIYLISRFWRHHIGWSIFGRQYFVFNLCWQLLAISHLCGYILYRFDIVS